ncbi:glycine-rich domain-containing protein [Sphingomonas jatrophae]|uniref:TIGR04222 domain-containing protein n=1 Tax=Sphingomonas jatrophae TaxID=1166337 RepID=A0A1I6JI33_9SPHN|nr:hypothetical protein [Sphingomonas jatrophae]SFR78529.1 hypothetical protein SAMN05192580_0291 [Sphingomonas jatrophae]
MNAAKVTHRRSYRDDPVWQALAAMRIGPAGAALGFSERLARENGWSASEADRVMGEYRRFLYLAANGPVTPSDAVDQAWHLHLSYSRHYWDELCGRILRRPLHHGPTEGGTAEAARYHDRYVATLAAYQATFGGVAPADIWPTPADRFAVRGRRVDMATHWVVPRPTSRMIAALAVLPLLAACTQGASDWLFWGIVAVVLAAWLNGSKRRKARSGKRDAGGCAGGSCGSDGDGGDGCGGGCGGGD